jgi:parallel beta-helix repeat protein
MMPRGQRTVGARAVLLVGIVVVLVAAAAGAVSAQRAGNVSTVDSCTTIDAPGRYALTGNVAGDIENPDAACIEITASNVTLDGRGHAVTGTGAGHGIEIDGSESSVSNVTVRDLRASNWSIGVFALGSDNGTIRRTITENSTEGLALGASSNYTLVNNTARDNAIAVALGGESQNNTLREITAVENKWGIHFERESANNTVLDSVARNNSRWDYYSERNDAENTVENLELSTATLSFVGQNVALRSTTSPPPLPRGMGNLDSYVEVTDTRGGESTLSLTMNYGSARNPVELWRHDDQRWSPVGRAQVDGSVNTVSANLTEFGTFGVLADAGAGAGGPVTVSVDDGPVQRTLSTPTAMPTATPTPTPTTTAVAKPSDTEPTTMAATTDVARGASGAATDVFTLGPLRAILVVLGVAALVALGVVALRERDGGPGFNR